MIRSSSHSLKATHPNKRNDLTTFLQEHRRLSSEILDDLWENGLSVKDVHFSIQANLLSIPSMLPNNYLKGFDTWLSARMKQCMGKQVCSMIKAAVRKRSKQLYMLRKFQRKGKDTSRLQRNIDTQPLIKPSTENIKVELDPRFVDFQEGHHFDLFVRIKQIGKGISFNLPVKHTKVSQKWLQQGILKKSVRLDDQSITLFFWVKKTKPSGSRAVGADQGYKTALTLSDQQATQKCPHGHDLTTIQAKLARKKKGSKGFRKAQDHRTNYINWSLNQLNFGNIKEVRLEKIRRIRYKKSSSRVMTHWTYTEIKKKLTSLSETEGFRLKEVPNEFRSQRCSKCGWVRKANRRKKTFKCDVCGFTADADLNAAFNLELDLFEIPYWVRLHKLNRKGFFWDSEGFIYASQEPIVPEITGTYG